MNKDNIQHVPELRFPVFNQDWKRQTLINLIELIDSGWSPDCEERPAKIGEWGVLKTTSTVWDGYNELENKRLPPSLTPRPEAEVKSRDILITRAGPSDRVGVVVFVAKTRPLLMISDKLIRIRVNSANDGDFISRLLGSVRSQKYLHARKSGLAKAQVNISQNILKHMPLIVPSIEEQRKIAGFLGAVDAKLDALRRKRALLAEYKRGVMQKLFAQEIRFREFVEPINITTLKDISTDYYQGINTAADRIKYSSTGTPILQAKHITDEYISFDDVRYINDADFQKYSQKYMPESGDILISNIGTLGKVVLVSDKTNFLIAWNIFRIQLNKDIAVPGYVLAYLRHVAAGGYFERVKTGNATKFVNKRDVIRIKLFLPSVAEQQKIADFLTAIDDKITAVDQQIEKIEIFKKGLLQQMFV